MILLKNNTKYKINICRLSNEELQKNSNKIKKKSKKMEQKEFYQNLLPA